ncbi:hypothetical protein SEA_CECE_175 [Microbacterium phage Cece]|nr:hypothetical protein SEA_CECE_175 [Microbacterium phage Cece]
MTFSRHIPTTVSRHFQTYVLTSVEYEENPPAGQEPRQHNHEELVVQIDDKVVLLPRHDALALAHYILDALPMDAGDLPEEISD